MNKRIRSLLLSVVLICSMLATAVPAIAAPGDSGVSASVTEASPGDTFTVTLKVPETAKKISDMSLKVLFDNTVFEVTEYTIPSIAGMAKMQSTVAEANSNAFFSATYDSESSDADVTFTGIELTATFKVKDGATTNTYEFKLDTSVVVGSLTDAGLPDLLMTYNDFVNKSASVQVVAAPKPATSITLNKTETTIYTGSDETLIATVEPADTTDTVTWESGNTAIATVDTNGKVTAVAPGTASITAVAGSQHFDCVVTVKNAPCTHTNKTNIDEKPSTCKEKGWDAYSKCNDCGQLFDKDGNEISEILYRPLADHKYTATEKKPEALKTAGTCKDEARYLYSCEVCGKVAPSEAWGTFRGDFDPNNHVGGTYLQNQKDASCKEEGYTGDKYCSGCHAKLENGSPIKKSSHTPATTWSYDSEYHWKECTNAAACGEKLEKAAHSFEWVVDKAATEEATGLKHEECVCGATRNQNTEIPKLDHTHNWVETKAKASTCKEQGNNQYYYCTKCEKYYKADKVTETTVAAEKLPLAAHTATAHAAVEATCTKEGNIAYWTCSVCEKYFSDEACTTEITKADTVVSKKSHSYDESKWVSDSSKHWHACSVCGDKKDEAAHTYGSDNKCTECGYAKPTYSGGIAIIQKPVIEGDAGAAWTLSSDGTKLTISAKEGYTLADVTLNGTSKGQAAELTGLKTGDKVVISTVNDKDVLVEKLAAVKLVARSKMSAANGLKAVKVYWFAEDGSDINFDGYEIFRSTKRYSGYGKTPFFDTGRETYWNTAIKGGNTYYYKVRGYIELNGERYYTEWSKKAWRTVK